jgi:hypothetical protein
VTDKQVTALLAVMIVFGLILIASHTPQQFHHPFGVGSPDTLSTRDLP